MFVNLDLTSYPEMVQGLLDQKAEKKDWIEELVAPFDYFGISAGDKKGLMTLKTNKPGENSLYTILKLTESHQ